MYSRTKVINRFSILSRFEKGLQLTIENFRILDTCNTNISHSNL